MDLTQLAEQGELIKDQVAILERLRSRYPSFTFSCEEGTNGALVVVGQSSTVRIRMQLEKRDAAWGNDDGTIITRRLRLRVRHATDAASVSVNGNDLKLWKDGQYTGSADLEPLGYSRLNVNAMMDEPEIDFDCALGAAVKFLQGELDAVRRAAPSQDKGCK